MLERINELGAEKIVVAGPGFAKEHLQKLIEEKGPVKGQFFYGATNSVGITGLQELLKGNALAKVMQNMQLVKETKLIEEVFAELGKDSGLLEYGLEKIKEAIEVGAVKQLIVTDELLLEKREEIEQLMQKTEQMRGEIHLVSAEHEAGKKLTGLGGIVAFLRYKMH